MKIPSSAPPRQPISNLTAFANCAKVESWSSESFFIADTVASTHPTRGTDEAISRSIGR